MVQNTNINYVVGLKQTIKAIIQQKVKHCYIAKDAEEKVVKDAIELCNKGNIPITYFDSMIEMGSKFGINVGAAIAAQLK